MILGSMQTFLLIVENSCADLAEEYLPFSFELPRAWVRLDFGKRNPREGLEVARENLEELMKALKSRPEAMGKLTPLWEQLRDKQRRCNPFYGELEEILRISRILLNSRVLNRTQENWLKKQIDQLHDGFYNLIEESDLISVRRKCHSDVTNMKSQLDQFLIGIAYGGVDAQLKALEEPLLNMEIDMLMAENR
jgi:hypothetical protein